MHYNIIVFDCRVDGNEKLLKIVPDWTEEAANDDHLWSVTSHNVDFCYIGESECSVSRFLIDKIIKSVYYTNFILRGCKRLFPQSHWKTPYYFFPLVIVTTRYLSHYRTPVKQLGSSVPCWNRQC